MNFKRAKQEYIEQLRETTILPSTGSKKHAQHVYTPNMHAGTEIHACCPLLQEPSRIRVLRKPDYKCVSYANALNFEDNQFKKNHVDAHDQVISMMFATSGREADDESS